MGVVTIAVEKATIVRPGQWRTLFATAIYFGVGLVAAVSLQAQEIASKLPAKQKPKVELLDCKVRVTDPDGNPVEGATVYCTGLRTRQNGNAHWTWRDSDYGVPVDVKTDVDGIAIMKYPRYVNEKLETGWMTWSVDHPDFIAFREDRDVTDDPAEIQLKRGFRIALTAVNAKTKEKITSDLYAVLGLSGGGDSGWKLKKNGTLVSGVLAPTNCFLRVIQIVDGKPTLFSKEIKIDPGNNSRVLLKDVELAVGTRLEGKLDESVPRPIKNGYVSGMVFKKITPNDWTTIWRWADKAVINEDGSFVFESLPSDCVWQMFPICDGYVPSVPKVESVAKYFPKDARGLNDQRRVFALPQLVKLEEEKMNVTLRMEPAVSAKLTFVDSVGNPIPGVSAAVVPNQIWYSGGSTILGRADCSRELLLKNRRGEEIQWLPHQRFVAKSDENGVAIVRNLPGQIEMQLVLEHDDFELPIDGGHREKRITLVGGEVNELTVELQKKGQGPALGDDVVEERKVDLAPENIFTQLGGVFTWVF